MDRPIRLIDKWEQWIEEKWNSGVYANAHRYVAGTIQPIVDRLTLPLGCNRVEMEPEEASQVLRECITEITDKLVQSVQGYSSFRWLWMLRRVPGHVFRGHLATTAGYYSTLAEVISGASNCNREDMLPNEDGCVGFPVDNTVLRRLARFCVAVGYLYNRHIDYRWSGKGASFVFRRNNHPRAKASDEIKTCVRLYDQRVASAPHALGRLGTVAVVSGDLMSESNSIFGVQPTELEDIAIPLPANEVPGVPDCKEFILPCRFRPVQLPLEGIQKLLSDDRIEPQDVIKREVATLIFLMFCLCILVTRHSAGWRSLLSRGYLLWPDRSTALAAIDAELANPSEQMQPFIEIAGLNTTNELLSSVESMTGTAWPLIGGPVARLIGDGICFDFDAASKRLDSLLEFPAVQGEVANARSEHFEKSIQSIIGQSAWKPDAETEAFRGKTLRLNGADLTDIDAIGEKDGTLLMASCKATVYSAHYDVGDYKTIRNISTHIRDARSDWDEIEATLMDSPDGDNYNFSRFTHMISVVCTPNVVYTDETTMMAVAAEGLPGVVSATELAQWLDVPLG